MPPLASPPAPHRTLPILILAAAAALCATAGTARAAPTYTVVHHFGGPRDGIHPAFQMVQDKNGTIWGVTPEGGRFGGGTIWRLDPTGRYRVFLSFPLAADPARSGQRVPTYPQGLQIRADGQLIGTTGAGGLARLGYLYSVSRTNAASLKILRVFTTLTGSNNSGGLTTAPDGAIWGPLAVGGPKGVENGGGAIFSLNRDGTVATRHAFSKTGPDNDTPIGGLAFDTAGNIWGATAHSPDGPGGGAAGGAGALYQLDPTGALISAFLVISQPTIKYDLASRQVAAPVIGPDGVLYGTSTAASVVQYACPPFGLRCGGTYAGAVYRRTPDGVFTFLHLFTGDDGAWPSASMVLDRAGALWGVTRTGNTALDPISGTIVAGTAHGAVFRIRDPAGTAPVFDLIHAFADGPADGARPEIGRLLLDRRGTIWGLTSRGGQYGAGTLFRIDPGT